MPQSRQLAAIMFTDIVGYTAIMSEDERIAFALLQKNRELQKPIIEAFNGQWIKELGDGVLASFNTASDAISAAIRIQEECATANEFQLRIGIHLGEVVFEHNDVFGDGVNIASRIESLGIPGSVLLSKSVRDQVKNNPDFLLVSLGAFDFKNVPEPLEVFALANPGFVVPKKDDLPVTPRDTVKRSGIYKWLLGLLLIVVSIGAIWHFSGSKGSSAAIPDKSIAVLPFVNMSDDPEQEYFSDGLSEELINVLAKTPQLKVIGRTSSFAFKGRNEDLREIGQMLGVSYLLEGSVRKAGNTLRITAQLINAADGSQLYAEKFERKLEDVFAIQDEISLDILDAVKIQLLGAVKQNVLKRYTDNVEAYQLYLKARAHYHEFTPDGFAKAIAYFQEAIALDSTYAIAYAGMSFCYMNLYSFNWWPPERSLAQGIAAAERALELDSEIAESHLAVGRIKLHYEWDIDEALAEYKKAIAINPNSAETHVQLGFCATFLGNETEAIEHAARAVELDPFSLLNRFYLNAVYWAVGDLDRLLAGARELIELEPHFAGGYEGMGDYYLLQKKYEKALAEYDTALTLSHGTHSLWNVGTVHGLMGNQSQAREVIEKMKQVPGAEYGGNNMYLGAVYAAIGELDTAFQYYGKAVEDHESMLIWAKFTFRIVPGLVEDPRAKELFDRIYGPG